MNLLLVDDEPIVLRKLERAVTAAIPGCVCNSFDDAEEAMDYAATEKIDIAFLDINMSYMDGVEMAKHLIGQDPNINIIFCTGYSEFAFDAHEIYASGYLLKPITEQKILEVLPHLRHPVSVKNKKIRFQCFGNFEVFGRDGKPMHFQYSRTKELLAFLVDANGEECSSNKILEELFENSVSADYLKQLRRDLNISFEREDSADVLILSRGTMGIRKDLVECDYYDYLMKDQADPPDEYMTQYSFAESTYAKLLL